ncbi:MAG TPA: efflux RND transporter permease subunit [Schlesneria sp.]|jgi:multidrug efflux pump subunit AcrB
MWIVRLALQRPHTFVVMALLIVVLGATSISQMRTDIFPEIDIPVVTVIWTYKGMESSEVERRITVHPTIWGDELKKRTGWFPMELC